MRAEFTRLMRESVEKQASPEPAASALGGYNALLLSEEGAAYKVFRTLT